MSLLKIEEVAKRTGLTKRTIRFYEEINLIAPPQRSEGGMRLYTEEDIQRLQRILDARNVLGYSLQELQLYLSIRESVQEYENGAEHASPTEQEEHERLLASMRDGLREQLKLIDSKMEKMESFKNEMTSMLKQLEAALDGSSADHTTG